jgi:hypothetical protein
MTRKQQYDWARIEADWRTGRYTNRELSKLHGPAHQVIARRATQGGWKQDLSKAVQEATRAILIERKVTEEVTTGVGEVTDRVKVAATVAADVVESHQRGLSTLKGVVESLAIELRDASKAAPLLAPEEVISLAEAKGLHPAEITNLLMSTQTAARAATADKLASAWNKLVPLERKAHGMDDVSRDSGDAAAVLEEYKRIRAEMRGDA